MIDGFLLDLLFVILTAQLLVSIGILVCVSRISKPTRNYVRPMEYPTRGGKRRL